MIVEHLPQVKTKQETPEDVYTYISPKVPHGPSGCGRPHCVGEEAARPRGRRCVGPSPHFNATQHLHGPRYGTTPWRAVACRAPPRGPPISPNPSLTRGPDHSPILQPAPPGVP